MLFRLDFAVSAKFSENLKLFRSKNNRFDGSPGAVPRTSLSNRRHLERRDEHGRFSITKRM